MQGMHGTMSHMKMAHKGHMHMDMESGHMTSEGVKHKSMEHGNMARGGNMMHSNMMHGHMMQGNQFFSAASYQSDFILQDMNISTVGGLIGAMVVVLFLAAFLEGFKQWLHIRQENGTTNAHVKMESKRTIFLNDCSVHLLTTLHKMLTVALGYLLMLCVMTMNVWMLVSATLGAGIGYLLIRPAVSACFAIGKNKHYPNGTGKHEVTNLVGQKGTDAGDICKDGRLPNGFVHCHFEGNGENGPLLGCGSTQKQIISVL